MTHLKITGGTLKIRDSLSPDSEEKINQIRLYSGSKFEMLKEAEPGMVVAVTGISDTKPGQVFGSASDSVLPLLEPVLTYRILLPFGTDSHTMLRHMRMLEEEDPQLHIVWNEALGEIQAQVMGRCTDGDPEKSGTGTIRRGEFEFGEKGKYCNIRKTDR